MSLSEGEESIVLDALMEGRGDEFRDEDVRELVSKHQKLVWKRLQKEPTGVAREIFEGGEVIRENEPPEASFFLVRECPVIVTLLRVERTVNRGDYGILTDYCYEVRQVCCFCLEVQIEWQPTLYPNYQRSNKMEEKILPDTLVHCARCCPEWLANGSQPVDPGNSSCPVIQMLEYPVHWWGIRGLKIATKAEEKYIQDRRLPRCPAVSGLRDCLLKKGHNGSHKYIIRTSLASRAIYDELLYAGRSENQDD